MRRSRSSSSTTRLLDDEQIPLAESEPDTTDGHDFTALHLADEFHCTPEVLFNSKRKYRMDGTMAVERNSVGLLRKVKNALDINALTIACTSFAGSLLGALFGFYYVKVFLTIYHLNNRWLNVVQILFAIWNAVNDPLFGYLQDVGFSCCPKWFMNRRKVILYIGPLYALSFMLFWIPWSTTGHPPWLVGMHLLVALFLYDTTVTFVFSAQCGLFTEATTKHEGRVKTVVFSEMAGMIGGLVIFPVNSISNSLQDFYAFQLCTAAAAVVAAVFLCITGLFASDKVAHTKDTGDDGKEKMTSTKDSFKDAVKSSKEILSNRDFWCVVLGNFFHIMRTTGDANFLAILTEALLSPNGILVMGSVQQSLFYTACSVLPSAFLICCWSLLQRCGAYVCLMMTLVLSAVNCVITAFVGRTSYTWLAMFFLFENILGKSLWPAVYNIFFPDIIDEDMVLHKRKSPISTLIFTMNALFTKPAYSIVPMLVVAVLNDNGYVRYLQVQKIATACNTSIIHLGNVTNCTMTINSPVGVTALPERVAAVREGEFEDLFSTMFYVACLYPLACVILEALCFIPYRLKFRHKRDEDVSLASLEGAKKNAVEKQA